MFFHNFRYTFITLFKNKILIFWTFAFPILLGTFFQMAFQDIENSETLHTMNIAVVQTDAYESSYIWKKAIQNLSEEGSPNQLFSTIYISEEEAMECLDKGDIIGYLKIEETPKIVVKKSGIYQTIFKSTVEEIKEQETMIKQLIQKIDVLPTDYNSIYQEIEKSSKKDTNIINISRANLSYTMIEFYTLIAMTALYGGILGMTAINQVLANMSHNGKRIAISPVSKGKLILSSAVASYIVQLIGMALLFFYTIFVLKVDYGTHFFLVLLLALIGSLAGLSMGIAIASILKTNENVKTGIIISVTMLGCFLSGMMGITMKYMIDKNIPIINKINPASMITDGFYALYYYDTLDRFFFNIMSLFLFAALMVVVSIFYLRRQKYDSI